MNTGLKRTVLAFFCQLSVTIACTIPKMPLYGLFFLAFKSLVASKYWDKSQYHKYVFIIPDRDWLIFMVIG